jgi:hypothetical protein
LERKKSKRKNSPWIRPDVDMYAGGRKFITKQLHRQPMEQPSIPQLLITQLPRTHHMKHQYLII